VKRSVWLIAASAILTCCLSAWGEESPSPVSVAGIPRVPLLSNRIEFKVTEAMLGVREQKEDSK
jgi:hypothetical protein